VTDKELSKGLSVIWTRDQFIGGLDKVGKYLKGVIEKGREEEVIADRRESVKIWEEIVRLAETVKCANESDASYILTSSMYGLRLAKMNEAGWEVMICGLKAEKGTGDLERLKAAIMRYDEAKKSYFNLPRERPDAATLYTDQSVRISIADGRRRIEPLPGMGDAVERFRKFVNDPFTKGQALQRGPKNLTTTSLRRGSEGTDPAKG
jgi:hypothetical protein